MDLLQAICITTNNAVTAATGWRQPSYIKLKIYFAVFFLYSSKIDGNGLVTLVCVPTMRISWVIATRLFSLVLVHESSFALHVARMLPSCASSHPMNLFTSFMPVSLSPVAFPPLLRCRGGSMVRLRPSQSLNCNQCRMVSGVSNDQSSNREGGGSVLGAAALIAGTTIGGGFLGLPHFTRDLVMMRSLLTT
jgi:hypothetical protein